MQLLLLLIIFTWIGYALSRSQTGKKIDQAVENSISWAESSFQSLFRWLRRDNSSQNQPITFSQWVATKGKTILPTDVFDWINGLSDTNARKFETSLTQALAKQGINLETAIQSQDQNTGIMQIFVEAVVVYSREYQKAVRAKPKKKTPEQEQYPSELPQPEEKAAAQKQPSRRKSATPTSAITHPSGGD
jgi:hypothetical protein